MNDHTCGHLDDYLGGELLEPERSRFECHLRDCPSCSDEVAAFSCLKRRLASAAEHEPCPPDLIRRVESQILVALERDRFRWSARIAVAAAAVCVAAWLTLGLRQPQPPEPPSDRNATARTADQDLPKLDDPRAPEGGESIAAARVEFTDDYLAVPIETDDPQVTILWVYPTTDVSTPADSGDSFKLRREL